MADELTDEQRLALLLQVWQESDEVERVLSRGLIDAAIKFRQAQAEAVLGKQELPADVR